MSGFILWIDIDLLHSSPDLNFYKYHQDDLDGLVHALINSVSVASLWPLMSYGRLVGRLIGRSIIIS